MNKKIEIKFHKKMLKIKKKGERIREQHSYRQLKRSRRNTFTKLTGTHSQV